MSGEYCTDLVIAREYISHGMRERAAEIVSLDLGPRTTHEIEHRLRIEVEQERLTSIDRELLRERSEDGFVQAAYGDAFRQTIRAGRLQKLKRLGLAEDAGSGLWRLAGDTEPTLKVMGERGDIIKTIHRELASGQFFPSSRQLLDFRSRPWRSASGRACRRRSICANRPGIERQS